MKLVERELGGLASRGCVRRVFLRGHPEDPEGDVALEDEVPELVRDEVEVRSGGGALPEDVLGGLVVDVEVDAAVS